MAVFRVDKNTNYTTMSHYHFKERTMSLKAKGLLSFMLSLPDTWDYSMNGLVAVCKESETAIKSTLDELKAFGYLSMIKCKDKKGRFVWQYDIFERPHQEKRPYPQSPHMDNPHIESATQIITNKLKTKKRHNNVVEYSKPPKGGSEYPIADFSFELFNKLVYTCIDEVGLPNWITPKEVVDNIFGYFIEKRKERINTPHPKATKATIKKMLNEIASCTTHDESHTFDELTAFCYGEMIDCYFRQEFKGNENGKCDYSLVHFMLGEGIRGYCYYNTCYTAREDNCQEARTKQAGGVV